MNKITFFIGILSLFISCISCNNGGLLPITITNLENQNSIIYVEVADETAEMQKGLMHRNSLAKNQGMLFVFPEEQEVAFWMKNTLIPLDMIFLNKEKIIIDIIQADPCEADPCKNYQPKGQAKFVIEVNQGYAQRNIITIGNEVRF